MKPMNIMIVGVGGQGSLLASRLMGALALRAGFDVKVSEVHGMSQRGGSVVTYVKFGPKVYSPTIDPGEADLLISFELLEAVRYLPHLKKDGVLLTSTQQIMPMPVLTGAAAYPEDIVPKIENLGVRLVEIDAAALSAKAGHARTVNMVMMGAASVYMNMPAEDWQAAMASIIPVHLLDMNKAAFQLGRSAGEGTVR